MRVKRFRCSGKRWRRSARLAAPCDYRRVVTEARQSHRPVTISENGEPVAALIGIDDGGGA
jgi:hypothetical protein